jgi:hypothetical protein
MGVSLALAIMTLLTVPFRAFCHFADVQVPAEGFSANMAISGKTILFNMPIFNEL